MMHEYNFYGRYRVPWQLLSSPAQYDTNDPCMLKLVDNATTKYVAKHLLMLTIIMQLRCITVGDMPS